MRYLTLIAILLLCCVSPAPANELGDVHALLKSKVEAVMTLLQDKTLDKSSRHAEIIDIVTPIFDYQTMAKLSLGKKYWPTLSQEKQAAFSELFVKRLQQSYVEKLDIYTDEQILFEKATMSGKSVHVPTTLVSKDSRIEILYKFYRADDGWKIYDVEIGGVSVIQTYRSQFDGVLSNGSIDDLLEKLKADGAFPITEPGQSGT